MKILIPFSVSQGNEAFGMIKEYIVRTVLIFAVVLLLSAPANAQEAILAFVCTDRDQAEVLAGEMTVHSPLLKDARWSSCEERGQLVGEWLMNTAPTPFMGPLLDWEGDKFALYTNGIVVFIMFWINSYSPTKEA